MDKEKLTKLAATIDVLGIMFVMVGDKEAAIIIAETRDKLLKLYSHWYNLLEV